MKGMLRPIHNVFHSVKVPLLRSATGVSGRGLVNAGRNMPRTRKTATALDDMRLQNQSEQHVPFLSTISPLMETENTAVANVWGKLVKEVTNDRYWLTSGQVSMPPLRIDGQLHTYPFDAASCQSLIAIAAKAPFGRGNETVIDDKVRKAWQIDANRISCDDPAGAHEVIRELAEKVRAGMSLPNIRLELYKMLIYEEGGHFKPHKDTLRGDHHIGSVIVTLPMATKDQCTGGELVVRSPDGKNSTWDGQTQGSMASYAAFFTDCDHELLPLKSGYRVALAFEIHYNLTNVSGKKRRFPVDSLTIPHVWADRVGALASEILKYRRDLYILCRHEYGKIKDPARQLKGVDLMLHKVLKQHVDKSKYTVKVQGGKVFYVRTEDPGSTEPVEIGSVGKLKKLSFFRDDPFEIDSTDGKLHCLVLRDDGHPEDNGRFPQFSLSKSKVYYDPGGDNEMFWLEMSRDHEFPYDRNGNIFFLWQSGWRNLGCREVAYVGNSYDQAGYSYRAHWIKVCLKT